MKKEIIFLICFMPHLGMPSQNQSVDVRVLLCDSYKSGNDRVRDWIDSQIAVKRRLAVLSTQLEQAQPLAEKLKKD